MSLVTVIIATFNSARTLPLVLASIRRQSYPKNCIEILVVDGGSIDQTVVIAKKFGCRIIPNLKVEPINAKYVGYLQAKGAYIMFMDHDEVLINPESISAKIELLRDNPSVKAAIGSGYQSPKGYNIINRYINEFGDSFSFFMYRLSKNADFFLTSMRRRYPVVLETLHYAVFDLSARPGAPIIELVTAGSVIDARFYKKMFPEIKKKYYLMPHLLHLLRQTHPLLGIVKNDVILHYSSDTFRRYIPKIIWRVKNNIFYTETIGVSGFAGREDYETPFFRLKKYLFVPYACSLILPCLDAAYLMVTRKDLSYSIHVPLTIMTVLFILCYSLLKLIGIKPSLTSYDGMAAAYENN